MGAEGRGLASLTRRRCSALAAIPQFGALGSLNVAAAGAVACFELARRRAAAAGDDGGDVAAAIHLARAVEEADGDRHRARCRRATGRWRRSTLTRGKVNAIDVEVLDELGDHPRHARARRGRRRGGAHRSRARASPPAWTFVVWSTRDAELRRSTS